MRRLEEQPMDRTAMNASSASPPARTKGRWPARALAVLPLGLWRARRMWLFLLVIELGMTAAVALACPVPLFAQIALDAGLQAHPAHHPANPYAPTHTCRYAHPSPAPPSLALP